MTHDEARQWAEEWTVTGDPSGIVHGRDALSRSWTTALAARPDLHVELDDVHLGVDCISIQYRSQAGRHVTEMAVFDGDGQVARGWGLYDAG